MAIKKCNDVSEEVPVTDPDTDPGSDSAVEQNEASKVKELSYIGKTLKMAENEVYETTTANSFLKSLLPVTTFGNGYVRSTRPSDISDPLRAEARKFFSLNKDGQLVYINSDLNELGANADTIASYGTSIISIDTDTAPPTEVSGDHVFKKYKQEIRASSKLIRDSGESDNAWLVITEGTTLTVNGASFSRTSPLIDVESTFTDHHTDITIPFSKKELERFANNVNNPSYANVESKYNFFSTGYEDYISSGDIKEYQLQNQFSNITREASYIQKGLFSQGTDLTYVKGVQALHESQGFDITEKYQNIGIPSSQVVELNKVLDTDDLYPMINSIEMNTDRAGKLLSSADKSGLTDSLLQHVMDQTIIYPDQRVSAASNNGLDFVISEEQIVFTDEQVSVETEQKTQIIPLIDLEEWIISYFSHHGEMATALSLDSRFNDMSILLGIDPNRLGELDACNRFTNTLKALILSGKINQIVDDNFRTFEEMLEGKEAYNETVIYEIKKTSTDLSSTQRVFIPNTENLDVLKYVDTQVKYNKSYTYEVFVHQLIVGTKYSYSTEGFSSDSENATMDFAVNYEPSLKIARIPIYSQKTLILDSAPVFPNVNIIPYKGISDRILININSNVGDYELNPIIIDDNDEQFAKSYRESRNIEPSDPIRFKSDDPVSRFEIYKMTVPPMSYQDFSDRLLAIVSTNGATSTSFVDDVEPNTKYYYTFRSIDIHGNRSNPTDVYVAELVKFEGMIFFNSRVYNFEDISYDNVKVSRDFRRYLKINPNLIQSLINYDQSLPEGATSAFDAASISLGQAGEPVWDKRFKMRVTSKNSGKKFDINFTCKAKYNRPSDEPVNPPNRAVSIPKSGLTADNVNNDFRSDSGESGESPSAITRSAGAGFNQNGASGKSQSEDTKSSGTSASSGASAAQGDISADESSDTSTSSGAGAARGHFTAK